ncbi:MAG: DegQ family serine endoprotease, partial [Desulfobacterales bacterium]
YSTILLLSAFLFYFSQELEAKKQTFGTATIDNSFSRLVKKASPSVVNISAVRMIKSQTPSAFPFGSDDPLKEFFEKFFRQQLPREFRQNSLGTGFIVDREGHILTNNHVVDQTTEIKVKLVNNREYPAEIIGRDPLTDLALIRVTADHPLEPLAFGDSDRIEVGDWVIAIGNPYGLGNTVTAGIVSAKYRQIGAGVYDNFIQTDTPINPGNSGGPLLNMAGEVIGLNTALFSESGGNVGIGFAIPINMARDLLPQLKKGKVVRGWLGVAVQKITPELKAKLNLNDDKGALVSDVLSGGPAERAGIQRGDVIISFNEKQIDTSSRLPHVVASTPVGEVVAVEVIRKDKKMAFMLQTGELETETESTDSEAFSTILGMALQPLYPELAQKMDLPTNRGLLIVDVEGDSPAAEARLMPGDIIVEVDQVLVVEPEELKQRVENLAAGAIVLLLVNRGGSTIYIILRVW